MHSHSFAAELYDFFHENSKHDDRIGQIHLSDVKFDDVAFYADADQINQVMKNLIESANSEVLFQLYNDGSTFDLDDGVKMALISLNEKARKSNTNISIKVLIRHPSKPSTHSTRMNSSAITWLSRTPGATYLHRGDKKHPIPNLNIEQTVHNHPFTSHPTMRIIVDTRTIMILNEDIISAANAALFARIPTAANTGDRFKRTLRENTEPSLFSNILLIEEKPGSRPIMHSQHQTPYITAVVRAINQATNKVKIMTWSLNNSDVIKAVTYAAYRKVKVQIVLGRFGRKETAPASAKEDDNLGVIDTLLSTIHHDYHQYIHIRWLCDTQGNVLETQRHKSLLSKIVIVDNEIAIFGNSPADAHEAASDPNSYIIESSSFAKSVSIKAFSTTFRQGRSANAEYFQIYKKTLCHNIQTHVTVSNGITLFGRADADRIQALKRIAITQLINDIMKAKSYDEVKNLLLAAATISEQNPLAQLRRKTLLGESIGQTDTIETLNIIIEAFNMSSANKHTIGNTL